MAHFCSQVVLYLCCTNCYGSFMPLACHEAVCYRIDLLGELDHSWSTELGGMSVKNIYAADGQVCTTLHGTLADQAALLGVLDLVCSLGMPVLLVQFLGRADVCEPNGS